MNGCERIREFIERRLDAEWSRAEDESVSSHLESCGECSAAQRKLQKIDGALKSMLAGEAAKIEFASFWVGVERRLNAPQSWLRDWRDRWIVVPRSAWAVPAIILLLLGVLSFESYFPAWRGGVARGRFASVDSIDAHGRTVALLRENETRTTVIWLYDEAEDEHETAEEDPKSGPAF